MDGQPRQSLITDECCRPGDVGSGYYSAGAIGIGAATQRNPSSYSSRSRVRPASRTRASSTFKSAASTMVRRVNGLRPIDTTCFTTSRCPKQSTPCRWPLHGKVHAHPLATTWRSWTDRPPCTDKRLPPLTRRLRGKSPLAIQIHATVRTAPVMSDVVHHTGAGLSIKQVAAGNILIGGGWPAFDLDLSGRSTISASSILSNVSQAQRVLPFLKGLRILRAWAGPLAATPDELPVIGEVPGSPGFLVAGGTYGLTLAPLWGRVLKDLALGVQPSVDLSQVTVERLVTGSTGVVQ